MIKAIFFKEWIKTKWIAIFGLSVLMGFTAYLLFNMFRVIDLKGAVHIWDVMIQRDAIFVDLLKFIPLLIGIALGVAQFVPEMTRKCLKLTLHLPFDATRMVFAMVGYGVVCLTVMFSIVLLVFYGVLSATFVSELVRHILMTMSVWFVAGVASYLFTAWIVLEPTWKRRIINIVMSILLLKIFFFESSPEAYNSFLPILIIYTLLCGSLAFLSVARFKLGKQD